MKLLKNLWRGIHMSSHMHGQPNGNSSKILVSVIVSIQAHSIGSMQQAHMQQSVLAMLGEMAQQQCQWQCQRIVDESNKM